MNNYNKKGQAAMEFLMTYGWAILAAIIVIGALGSYFYFNQGGSSSIFVTAPFYGIASQINSSHIIIEIDNKGGETLREVYVNVSGNDCNQTLADSSWTSTDGAQIIAISCGGIGSLTEITGDITVTYLRPGSSLNLTTTGSVSGPVV